jgi:hypothetical protein
MSKFNVNDDVKIIKQILPRKEINIGDIGFVTEIVENPYCIGGYEIFVEIPALDQDNNEWIFVDEELQLIK